ncbi:MAG: hypothetical protein AAFQ81_04800, partial [Pseudomonadota bacterium]
HVDRLARMRRIRQEGRAKQGRDHGLAAEGAARSNADRSTHCPVYFFVSTVSLDSTPHRLPNPRTKTKSCTPQSSSSKS